MKINEEIGNATKDAKNIERRKRFYKILDAAKGTKMLTERERIMVNSLRKELKHETEKREGKK